MILCINKYFMKKNNREEEEGYTNKQTTTTKREANDYYKIMIHTNMITDSLAIVRVCGYRAAKGY